MLRWLPRAVARRVRSEAFRKFAFVRSGISRSMAFSIEERGSPNDFDYRIFFSEFTSRAVNYSRNLNYASLLLGYREW